MEKIVVITDTDSSLPPGLAAQYDIRQVPITIHFDEGTFTTGIDIDDRSLFEIIDRHNKLPTTSAPSPAAFTSAFETAFTEGASSIICICVSSKVSATYSAAVTACENFPNCEITVVDSLNLSMGQGFMALAAAEALQRGATQAEAVSAAVDTGKRVHTYAVLSTLKYLALSGRVGKLVAGMADTFNIKPILTVRDGKLDLLERVRTRTKAIDRLISLVQASVGDKSIQRVAFIHVNNLDGVHDLQRRLCDVLPCPGEMIVADFTAGLAVHAGSGVVGVAILTG
jgi:DegV family protein with EDD domain